LAQAVDTVRVEEIQSQPPQIEPNPVEEIPPRPEGAAGEQLDKLTRLFQENPELLQTVEAYRSQSEQQVAAAQQQAQQYAEQASQQYAAAVIQNAQAALGSLLSAYPEMRGLNSAEAVQAGIAVLERNNPERAAAIKNHLAETTRLTETARQVQGAQMQAAQQWQQAAFQQGAKLADDAFERWIQTEEPSAERRQAITAYARQMLRDEGLDDRTIAYHWDSNPLLRSAAGQRLVADAARYRMAQAAARQKAVKPVPTVQRPGSPAARGSEQDWNLGKLAGQLGKTGSVKDATAYLIAKRAAARR
jgi:hypothetical protein